MTTFIELVNNKDSKNKNENQLEGNLSNQINQPFKSYIKKKFKIII